MHEVLWKKPNIRQVWKPSHCQGSFIETWPWKLFTWGSFIETQPLQVVKTTCVSMRFFHRNLHFAELQSLSVFLRFFQINPIFPKSLCIFYGGFLSFTFPTMEKRRIRSFNTCIFWELHECNLRMATFIASL
jgi:hypothetical protein